MEDLVKWLGPAVGAVWGFYGATQLALLGYVAFPNKDSATRAHVPTLSACLWLFFLINLTALVLVQSAFILTLPDEFKNNCLVWGASFSLCALHLALDRQSVLLVQRSLSSSTVKDGGQ